MPPHTADSPAKKQSKWSPEEDALIIELRGSGMKWEDISKRLPGRSAISCRLHYQNYLERRSEWDEERKNKLARLYERFKPEMWAKVAEELQVPWRAAEAMHWQLGETDMARRAGVIPFSLTTVPVEAQHAGHHRAPPSRGAHHQHAPPQPHLHHHHHHSQSQGSLSRDLSGAPSPRYARMVGPPPLGLPPPMHGVPGVATGSRAMAVRRESVPPPPRLVGPDPAEWNYYGHHGGGPGLLPPIQTGGMPQGRGGMLPGVAEITTGVSPYSTPAYSAGVASVSPVPSQTASPGPLYHSLGYSAVPAPMEPTGAKRRASPDLGPRETRRRHLDPRYDDGGGPGRESSRRP